jgi:hypothetical protein
MQTAAALCSCLLDGDFHVQQQRFHLPGPLLLVLFVQEGQVPQMMHVAKRMLAQIEPIRPPAIMHTDPVEVFEDADGVQGRFPSFGMDGIVGQVLRRTDMHPLTLACHVEARFILMSHVGLGEHGFDLLLYRC